MHLITNILTLDIQVRHTYLKKVHVVIGTYFAFRYLNYYFFHIDNSIICVSWPVMHVLYISHFCFERLAQNNDIISTSYPQNLVRWKVTHAKWGMASLSQKDELVVRGRDPDASRRKNNYFVAHGLLNFSNEISVSATLTCM